MVERLEEFVNTIRYLQKKVPQTVVFSGVFQSDLNNQDSNDPNFDEVPIHNFVVDSYQLGYYGDGTPVILFRGVLSLVDEESIKGLAPTSFIHNLLSLQGDWLDETDEDEKCPPFYTSVYIGLIAHTADTQKAYAIGGIWDIDGEEFGTVKDSDGTDLEVISVLSVFSPIPEDALDRFDLEENTTL